MITANILESIKEKSVSQQNSDRDGTEQEKEQRHMHSERIGVNSRALSHPLQCSDKHVRTIYYSTYEYFQGPVTKF